MTFLSELVGRDQSPLLPVVPRRHILLGDLNYSYYSSLSSRQRRPQAPATWLLHVSSHYFDGLTAKDEVPQPTFHRNTQRSCVDYIFLSNDLAGPGLRGQLTYIQPTWTDHLMLSARVSLCSTTDTNSTKARGKGV